MLKRLQQWLIKKLSPKPIAPIVTDRNRVSAAQLDEEDYQNWLARTEAADDEHVKAQVVYKSQILPFGTPPKQQMEDLRYEVKSE